MCKAQEKLIQNISKQPLMVWQMLLVLGVDLVSPYLGHHFGLCNFGFLDFGLMLGDLNSCGTQSQA